jgi:hypothetical protein
MPDRPARWQGQFELERTREAAALQKWCENRRLLGMGGLERATIRWADFHQSVAHEYTDAILNHDGHSFIFDNAKRDK